MSEQGQPQPSYAPKKAQMWPLWAIMGGLVIAVIAFLMRGTSTPEWAKVPEAERAAAKKREAEPPHPAVPVDPQTLVLGTTYGLSAEMTAVAEMGGDPAAGGTNLPADARISISSVRTAADGAKWYYIFAKDSGGAQIGWGWIAADWLAGQDLKRL